ncbi:AEC family transporter [Marinobacter confluentis]|uniref:AEC family transporter n=1 Tax=Marinobacter confluentis TaxID=1697557 RepID=A0A4Z1C6U0_9GAMM|nr:AEC family transporter [Marinobacter confluentis]TGN41300.1 AEC family transporter [Marinobacter confluentis]
MGLIAQALVPVFFLILMGYLFKRWQFPGDGFWLQAERFSYYVLFPAMLIFKLGQARVPASAYGDVIILVTAMLCAMTLVLIAAQRIFRWPGPIFSSVYQGGIRFNSFVAIATAGMLLGDDGLSTMAIIIAVMIPLINLLCILMFSLVVGQGGALRWQPVARAIVTNPLIIGSIVGALWGYFRIGFHPLLAGVLEPLSDLALPLGLMTVGAGLQLKALRGTSMPFLVASGLKLLGFPLITAGLALALGLSGTLVQAAILLSTLPTATSSYILARQLGGDAPLMAAIVSGQTLLAVVTIPLMLSLFW